MKLIRQFTNDNYSNFGLPIVYNDYTLNLFSDVSTKPNAVKDLAACYGAVAVCKDTIIDEMFRFNSICTVNAGEIRGIRTSLRLALKYADRFRNINIFSDSQLSIFSLRDYIYLWTYNPQRKEFYTKSGNDKVANQSLYVECYSLLMMLIERCNVNLFHQKAHISNKPSDLRHAIKTFRQSNQIYCTIDYNFIRYISMYNNYVDEKTRSLILRTDTNAINQETHYRDAIKLYINPTPEYFYR